MKMPPYVFWVSTSTFQWAYMQKWVRCTWQEALLVTSMAFQLLSAPHFSNHFTQLSGHFSQCKGSYDMPVWELSTTCEGTQENSSALTCTTCTFLQAWLSFTSLQLLPIWAHSSFGLECSAPLLTCPSSFLSFSSQTRHHCVRATIPWRTQSAVAHLNLIAPTPTRTRDVTPCSSAQPVPPSAILHLHSLLQCLSPPMRLSSMSDAKKIQTLSLNLLLEKLSVQKWKVLEEVVDSELVPAVSPLGMSGQPFIRNQISWP